MSKVYKRCPKHDPEQVAANALDALRGNVRCAKCGMQGSYSNGRSRSGIRRIIWFRRQNAADGEKLQAFGEYRAHGGNLDFTAWEETQEQARAQ